MKGANMAKRTKHYSNIGNRIRDLRNENSLTQKQLGEMVNKSESTVRMWELGYSEPDIDTLGILSNIFSVRIDYITGKEKEHTFDIFSIDGITPVKTKKLPVLGSVACGEPIFAQEEYQGYISVDEDIKADFCLLAKGNSMINAGIKDGSIVFVKKQPTVDNGQIAVVLIEDEATLKRVYFDEINKRLILNPCNDAYSPIIIDNEQLKTGQIRILGKAIACQFKVR